MPADPSADPWSGITYNGFSGPPASDRRETAPASRRPSTRTLLLGGVAVALGLGLFFGLLAKPNLKTDPVRPRTPTPAAAAAVDAGAAQLAAPATIDAPPAQVPIEVNQPPPQTAPRSAGKLEVLPPDLARAARAQAPQRPVPAVQAPVQAQAPTLPSVTYVTPPPAVTPAPLPTPAPAPRYRASFDCSGARPGAEQMVCSDAGLAAADRELAAAYRRALDAGAPARLLREDQQDWLDIREDAARHGRRAVASIYNQRIDELNEMAEGSGY